ncbi:MAG: PAS domain S-box protein [Promethearchaeota archaeon]
MTSIEKILIKSEEYIRKLFEGIPIPMYVWQRYDNDFILVDYNDATNRDLKEKSKKKIGVKASEFYKDHPKIIQDLNKCFMRQKNMSKEVDYTVKSTQEVRSLSIRYSFIPPELVLIYLEDITEKKYAKQKLVASEMKCKQLNKELEQKVKERTKELEESKENYRNLLDNLDVGFYQVTLDGHMINLNQAHKIILGYDPTENLKSKDVRMFWQYPEQREEYINQLLKEGSVKDYICHSLTKDDKEIIVQLNSHLIRDKTGNPIRIDGTFMDITEKYNLEQKLKESEEKYRVMTELLPDIIYEADLKLNITYVNKIGFKKFGYTPEDLKKGVNIKDLVSPEYAEKAFLTIKSIFNRNITEPNEYLMVRKDGTKFYARLNSRPIIKNDKVVGLRGTVTDINDMVIAEQNLKESESKYREAFNRASFYKDLFAHDINNILQIMNSSAELISLQLKDSNQMEDIESIANIIKKQVSRGTKLVNNVRILSELEESELLIQPTKACDILLKSIEYVKKAYNDRDLNVEIDCPDNEIYVIANELLQDVFENILINAIKYNENPSIEILISIFRGTYENNTYFRFEFIDNGIGIQDERKRLIFERRNGELRSDKGMGLGLSLVSKIINYYNGKIWIEDKVKGDYSKGSKVIILLPESN